VSLEVGRKYGYYASLMNVIFPIVAVAVALAFVFSLMGSFASRIASGTSTSAFLDLFGVGFIVLLVVLGVIGLIAYIMFMYAMHNLSKYYNEPLIFKNVLYAFLLSIVSGVISFILVFATLLTSLADFVSSTSSTTTVFPQFIVGYLVVIGVSFVFAIINGVLYMRAFNKLKEKSGVDNFGTAGLLYLVGMFVPLIGWVAWIFAAMGFNKLKAGTVTPQYASYSVQPPMSYALQTKRCPNCSAANPSDALYCQNCGKPL